MFDCRKVEPVIPWQYIILFQCKVRTKNAFLFLTYIKKLHQELLDVPKNRVCLWWEADSEG